MILPRVWCLAVSVAVLSLIGPSAGAQSGADTTVRQIPPVLRPGVAVKVAVITTNDASAHVYADSLWLGPASVGVFPIPAGTRAIRVVPSAIGTWGVAATSVRVGRQDTVRVTARFPYIYKLEASPYSARVFLEDAATFEDPVGQTDTGRGDRAQRPGELDSPNVRPAAGAVAAAGALPPAGAGASAGGVAAAGAGSAAGALPPAGAGASAGGVAAAGAGSAAGALPTAGAEGNSEVLRELLGITPVTLSFAHPLSGTLVFEREGFAPVRIRPDSSLWNRHVAVLSPLEGRADRPVDVRLDLPGHSGRWIDYAAVGAAVVGGAFAVHYKIKADRRYDVYRETGNPDLRPRIEQLDNRSAVALGAMQVGVGVFAFRLVFR